MARKWSRRLGIGAGAAAAALTGLAAMNRSLRQPRGALTSALEATQCPWQWRGYQIFACEAGSGPLVLLVHGIYAGSSSYEFRKLLPLLARQHRVVAFDLLGNGLSERPNIAYSADLFTQQIEDAVTHFGRPSATAIVASSLGAAFAVRAARRLRERVAKLAIVCPTGLAGSLDRPPSAVQARVTDLFRSPVVGEALFNGLASRPSLRWFLENQAYAEKASATPDIVDAYYAATHQPGARYVPAHFVGGALNCAIGADLALIKAPVLVAWGERADGPSPVDTAGDYVKAARDARLITFAKSRLLPHEEEPESFADHVSRFVAAGAS